MKNTAKIRRQERIRAKIEGSEKAPRLSVHRTLKSIYVQFIDDKNGKTILGVSEKELKDRKGTKTDKAKKLGILAAEKALAKKIKKVIFDRGSYKYHGRVKAVADGAREGGLEF